MPDVGIVTTDEQKHTVPKIVGAVCFFYISISITL